MAKHKRVAVITEKDSDILKVLRRNGIEITVFRPGQMNCDNLDRFYSIMILGGTSDNPLILHPRERLVIEEELKKGKKIFSEYCGSIGHIYFEPPVKTRFERLMFSSEEKKLEEVKIGDLLDDQCGMRIRPYPGFCSHNRPILQYVLSGGHSKVQKHDIKIIENKENIPDRGLWFNQENLLICGFCLANYNKARYAPKFKFKKLIQFILEWVTDTDINIEVLEEHYSNKWYEVYNKKAEDITEMIRDTIDSAMEWFEKGEILLNDGKDGVLEGLGTEIYPDGKQRVCSIIRNDCVGETALAYFMYSLLKSKEKDNYYHRVSDNLATINFDMMQCKDNNQFHGMMRWTQEAWGVCYQDDVARAIIPQMLKALYSGYLQNREKVRDDCGKYMMECIYALDFLLKTTGTDGTRIARTDNIKLNKEKINELANNPAECPSGHYNGYYFAALLLGYKLTGLERFKTAGIKGMETLMAAYPNTIREHSQTQEYCRLILPLSWLYWVSGEEKHKEWLYMVANDLQVFKHESGAYLEWDEGYKAQMRNNIGKYENTLLALNGDPVVDLLYSNNWLPIGFIQAYFVTKDTFFKELWEETARFMVASQILSKDKTINGAWARGFDVEFTEIFGSPADIGWGPWAIESGWTVAEITAGLIMGLIGDKLIEFY